MSERVPERSALNLRDTWRLEDMYASQEAWEADYKKAEALLKAFSAFEGKLGDADELKKALDAYFDANRLVENLFTYARMRRDEDNRKTEYQGLVNRAQSLMVKLGTASSFFKPEILSLPAEYIEKVCAREDFADYRVPLMDIDRDRRSAARKTYRKGLYSAYRTGDKAGDCQSSEQFKLCILGEVL